MASTKQPQIAQVAGHNHAPAVKALTHAGLQHPATLFDLRPCLSVISLTTWSDRNIDSVITYGALRHVLPSISTIIFSGPSH